jgi:phosphoglycolate phosphatase-like HAD superfamily hydrolase
MKHLAEYISEALLLEAPQSLKRNETGVIVFDIDDTLLKSDPSQIKIYKREGNKEIALTTDEFAKDPDANDPSKEDLFDLRDFRDPVKVYNSIISGTPLLRNLRILDDYINAGYEFCFLTARAHEEVIKQALDSFLKVRKNGVLQEIGEMFNKTLSAAVNDTTKSYPGSTSAEKKANVLRDICSQYDKVVFVDDDRKNVNSAINMNLKNLKVIKAQ